MTESMKLVKSGIDSILSANHLQTSVHGVRLSVTYPTRTLMGLKYRSKYDTQYLLFFITSNYYKEFCKFLRKTSRTFWLWCARQQQINSFNLFYLQVEFQASCSQSLASEVESFEDHRDRHKSGWKMLICTPLEYFPHSGKFEWWKVYIHMI